MCYVRRILAQHLLFVFLAIIAPAWDLYDTRRLKKNADSLQKITYYKTTCAWLWIASCLAVLATGFQEVFTINAGPDDAAWLFGHEWVRYLVGAVTAMFAALMLLPYFTVTLKKLKKQPRTYRSAELFKAFDYLFPATVAERRWWVFTSLTAGFCEEILFRGFLLHYLHVFPWRLNLTLALLISSLMFGLNHLYGGMRNGLLAGTVAGFLLGFLFLLSGNLLLPMILHALTDLRMLVILPPPAKRPAPQTAT